MIAKARLREKNGWDDHEAICAQATTSGQAGQMPFVAPTPVQPRSRYLDETVAFVDAVERRGLTVGGHHSQQHEPALQDRDAGTTPLGRTGRFMCTHGCSKRAAVSPNVATS